MKEKRNRGENRRSTIYMFFMDIVFQAVCFFPWIPAGKEKLNIITYVIRMFSSGDSLSYIEKNLAPFLESYREVLEVNEIDGFIYVFYMHIILMTVVQLVGIIHMFFALFGKKAQIVYIVMAITGAVNVALVQEGVMYDVFVSNIMSAVCVGAMLALPVFTLASVSMMESWTEATREYRALKKRDLALKKERKRRLKFPGKYTSLFYRVIWKNFRHRIGIYKIFLIVGSLSVSFIFAGIGMREMLAGQKLGTEMMNFLAMAITTSVFLIVNVLLFYMKNHMKDYSMFLNLGMRKQTLKVYIAIGLVSSMLFSLFAGLILGNGILILCRTVITRVQEDMMTFLPVTRTTYLFTGICVLLVFVVSLFATHDIYIDTGMAGAEDKAVKKEKMPEKGRFLRIEVGIVCVIAFGKLFAQKIMAENIYVLFFFFLGCYLILKTVWSMLLKAGKKKEESYYRGLMKSNYLYYRFKTVFRYTFFIGIVHLCILFVFAKDIVSIMAAPEPEKLFPYDYVCLGTEEDETYFEGLKNEYQAEISIYPMVRATNADNTLAPDGFKDIVLPQGQHIGISVSTYRKLCEQAGIEPKELNLSSDGKQMYILYQQDCSVEGHPIDYFAYSTIPYIHIGQPVTAYDFVRREEIFPKREIAGEEKQILIGALRQGEYENLLIFSDEYMEQVKDSWKTYDYVTGEKLEKEGTEGENIHHWPTRLVLIKADKAVKRELKKELEDFQNMHEFDRMFDASVLSCYDKDTLIEEVKADRVMRLTVNIFIAGLMFLVGIIMLYLKNEAEIDERRRKHEFLICMGVSKKDRIRIFRTEYWSFLRRPMEFAVILTIFFTGIVWKLRDYSRMDCLKYSRMWVILFSLYLGLQVLIMKIMESRVIRKVEK